jgi:hypothetical protein
VQFPITGNGVFDINMRDEFISSTSQYISQSLGYHGAGLDYISTEVDSPALGSIFDSYSILSGLSGSGHFNIGLGTAGGIDGYLTLETLIANGGSVATVPEPATWAMLLIGFAGIGFVAYSLNFRAGCYGAHRAT